MNRRRFVLASVAGVIGAPLGAEAQGPPKERRMGYLYGILQRYSGQAVCSEQCWQRRP
jgi:hypothetical protein